MMVLRLLVLGLASFAAAAINAIAGGGSFLTFPSLTGVMGLTDKAANMTNTIGLWPGAASSILPVTDQIRALPGRVVALYSAISLVSGGLGALLLQHTGETSFALILPWLLLTATVIFAFSKPIARWAGRGHGSGHSLGWTLAVAGMQFVVGIYGGYFGAGIGVLMLASLSFAGFENLHQVNALKVLLSTLINLVAAILFLFSGQIQWSAAGVMAVASIGGGFLGMGVARRVPQEYLRAMILCVGITLTAVYFVRNYHAAWR
jgi:uncharacterized membrane protein YfcA